MHTVNYYCLNLSIYFESRVSNLDGFLQLLENIFGVNFFVWFSDEWNIGVSRYHFRSWWHKSHSFYLDRWFAFNGNLLITFLYMFRFFRNVLCSLYNCLFDWLRRLFFEIWIFFNRDRNVMYTIDCYGFSFLVNLECLVSYFDLFFQMLDDFLALNRLV
jgi:hypothetical protein